MNGLNFVGLIANLVTPAAYCGVLAGVLLLFGRDWRVLLPIVLGQYAAVALVLTESLALPLAFSKLVVGLFVLLILYVTVRQIYVGGWMPSVAQREHAAESWLGWPVRLAVTISLVVGSWFLARQAAGEQSLSYLFATYSLIGLGIWGFLMTARPLRIGLGLLMILSGVELLYLVGEVSIWVAGFLAGAHLVTAVVVSYLAQIKPFQTQSNVITGKNV